MIQCERSVCLVCLCAMATSQEGAASTGDVLCEFLEAAIHTIIRVRGVSIGIAEG